MIALVDCNNFYASCERAFQPKLENRPIVVLSNNDGCIISRSSEAKAQGIKMGAPYFQIKDLLSQKNINVFSSNYTLYADMSKRVMKILKDFSVRQEVYSIDESFLELTGITNLTSYAIKMKQTVKNWTGIPVSVGLAETKVLAKFANFLAKNYSFLNGVCNLQELGENRVNKAMQLTPVKELWGVGHRFGARLNNVGINTVYDLKTANPNLMRKLFNINMEKIVYELNNTKCLDLECYQAPNKRIVSSRSFGIGINDKSSLLSSITYHIEKACEKLRKQKLYARDITIFIKTDRFKDDYLSDAVTITFPNALDSFRYMSKYIVSAIDFLFIPGRVYKKSGILLNNLITEEFYSIDLFNNISILNDNILPALENINKKFTKNRIKITTRLLSDKWAMNQNLLSKKYTTDVNELLVVY